MERDDELRTLSRLASEGGAGVAVITGEAGMGKSRLAQEFASSLPDDWAAPTATITRSRAALPGVPHPRPLALILEDAHFLDPVALESIPRVLEQLDDVLVVLTFRLGLHPAGSAEMRALARLVRAQHAHELRLTPLSPAGVEQMAAAMGRYANEDVYRRTGGNPFWAEQVLAGGDAVPWTVVETVTSQLDALPRSARELACALAVAEEPVPAASAGWLVDGADAAWAALADAGLVERYPATAVTLRHALVADAVRTRLGPAERARWHARLAAALESEPVARDRVARHWAAAGETERAAAIAGPAGAELSAQGATRRAFDCFEIATMRPPEDLESAAAVHEEAALTAARIGEYGAMQRWIAAADRLYREAGRPDRAARMRLDPAFDYLPVRRSGAIRDEPVERLLVDALAAIKAADAEAARRLVAVAVGTARARGDGMGLARGARMAMFALGEFEHGEALLEEALAFPDIGAHPGRESRVLTTRAVGRFAQGYPLESVDLCRRALAISRQEPDAVRWTGQIALGNALLQTGQIGEGAAALADAAPDLPSGAPMRLIADGYRRFEGGDVAGGLAAMTRGNDALLSELDFDPLGRAITGSHVLSPQALSEAHAGRHQAALRTVRRLDALSPEPFSDVAGDAAYVLARAGSALNDREALLHARRRVGDLARVASGPGVLAAAEAVRAFAAPPDEASRHFQAAAALFERAARPVLAAELWCDAAAAAGAGRVATAALARAERLCAEHALSRLAARAAATRDELAAGPRRAPAALAQLTSRERDVVALAADGLSNRQIGARLYLSEGTVRNYLSTAFAKLGVSRRGELARIVG